MASQARQTRFTAHFYVTKLVHPVGVQAAKNLYFGGYMRNVLLFSVLLLGASWMAAQTTTTGQGTTGQSSGYGQTTQSHEAATGNQKTVTGCLSEADGKYMLTTHKGMTYDLTGDSAKLADHVGHEIRVTGAEAAASGTASSTMGHNESAPTLEVSSFKHISKTCKTAGNMGGMSH
jgi:hypothetical protein